MSEEALIIEDLFNRLVTAKPIAFPKPRLSLNAPKEKGVYLILDNSDNVLHVGNTPRGRSGIFQRLNNHLHGKSSFTRQYFSGNGNNLRVDHFFKYLIVPDSRLRALLEAYAVGKLCPKHLGTG